MKGGFRQCMAWLHTWTGLVVGWVLFLVFLTGSTGYYAFEIDRWMRPELPLVSAVKQMRPTQGLGAAQDYLQAHAAGAQSWVIQLPGERSQPQLEVFWREPAKMPGQAGRFERAMLDPGTGKAVNQDEVRATGGGHLLYRMHYLLHYVPADAGIYIVGMCTMPMFLAIVTGIITHKKILSDFFTFRASKGQRSWMDAHNIISVTSLPFFLMITYSGLVFFMSSYYMPAGIAAAYGTTPEARQRYFDEQSSADRSGPTGRPAALIALGDVLGWAEKTWGAGNVGSIEVRHPGDECAVVSARPRTEGANALNRPSLRFNGITGNPLPERLSDDAASTIERTLLALHEGRFAGPLLRWLYFLAGLLGCAMIATGLVLWTAKRKVKQDKRLKAGQSVEFGFRLVDCLNIATVAGVCTAVAVYFWANRLIPVDFAERRAWEAHALFIAWGLLLAHAAIRPPRKAWVEQLGLAALAFGLLPLVNALTTHRHLGVTLLAGDWVLAGFDLTMLALGLVFAYAARKISRGRNVALKPQASGAAALATEVVAQSVPDVAP